MRAARHLVRYLLSRPEAGVFFKRQPPLRGENVLEAIARTPLRVFSDSDYAGCPSTKRSTSGFLIFFGDSLTHWRSKRQKFVTLSTCDAETVAGVFAWRDATHLRRIISEITGRRPAQMIFHLDNQAVIKISESGNFSSPRSRHIAVRYHKLHEMVADKSGIVRYVASKSNPADLLTKPITRTMKASLMGRLISSIDF